MCDQDNNDNTPSESSGKDEPEEKKRIPKPFAIRPDEVYAKQFLTEAMNLSKDTWAEYRKRGLKKLNTNTKQAFYLGVDIITIWRE